MPAIKEFADDELIEAIRSGNAIDDPVRFIYRRYFGVLSNYVEQNHGNGQDAEDVFQEAILTLIELVRQNKFRAESSIGTFLYSINRFIWLNELKKRGRQEKRNVKYTGGQELLDEGIEKYTGRREARQYVMSAIDQLGDVCKKILLLFYYEDLPIAEILTKLDYQNEQVVRNKKAKCMKTLEQKLKADPEMARNLKSALQYE